MLQDEILLEIFVFWNQDFCAVEEWHTLVHVCQRWRQIVFASPYRLNLEILCSPGTPVRKYLRIWPDLPIILEYTYMEESITPNDEDNIIAALEHPDRVSFIALDLTCSLWEKIITVMQEPFPELTYLCITSEGGNAPIFPPKFLGGHVPRVEELEMEGIPFPALPILLLSASNLRRLYLSKIPPHSYISPEAMVACLATLPRLEVFSIEFQSATFHPNRMDPPPITRAVLSALSHLTFRGASEYLEDLVARIDTPWMFNIFITYFNQFIDFQVAQLSKFISRSIYIKPSRATHAHITFFSNEVSFHMYSHWRADGKPSIVGHSNISVLCEGIDWQVSHMAQVLGHFSTVFPHINYLKLELQKDYQLEDTDDVEWHLLLHRFSDVQTLHVSQGLAGRLAVALEDMLEGMFAESLPSLDLIYLEGQPASSLEKFVAARQLSDRIVTVVHTKAEYDERLRSMKRVVRA